MHNAIKVYSRFINLQFKKSNCINNIQKYRFLSNAAGNVVESKENDGSIQSHENQNDYFSFMKNLFTGKIDTVNNILFLEINQLYLNILYYFL